MALPTTSAARLRRRLTRAALALVLGALTTAAIAWGCAALPIPAYNNSNLIIGIRPLSPAEGRGALNCMSATWVGCTSYSATAWGLNFSGKPLAMDPPPETIPPPALRSTLLPWCFSGARGPEPDEVITREALACGWPFRALSSAAASTSRQGVPGVNTATGATTPLHGLPVPRPWASHFEAAKFGGQITLLPIRPLWPGALLDTLLYAGAWMGLFATAGALRRTRRRRRGHCPACGYDRAGQSDAPCPECGHVGATNAEPPRGVTASARRGGAQ